MKKLIKNYLAELQEKSKKGFSLVELIIVMAIMAILVGVVASQVIPYMEKSRQSKDQQVLNSLLTDINSAIAQSGAACTGTVSGSADSPKPLSNLATVTNAQTVTELMELRPGYADLTALETELKGQLKSKAASGKEIYISLNGTTGDLMLFISDSVTGSNIPTVPTNERMIARSKEVATTPAPTT